MEQTSIRTANKEELRQIAALIAGQNRNPRTQTLQCSSDPDGVLKEMTAFTDSPEEHIVIATAGGRVVGAIACDYDPEDGRVWMWGPYVVVDDWSVTATPMLDGFFATFPREPARVDALTHVDNVRCHRFLLDHGFREAGMLHVYVAERASRPGAQVESCGELDDRSDTQRRSFAELHDGVFPGTYFSGEQILERRDTDNRLHVCVDGDMVVGYIYSGVAEDGLEGFVHFVAVQESRRGSGLGRRLLCTALAWLFDEKKMPRVGLIVSDDLTNARGLYESVGFVLEHTGVHARRG